MARLTQTQWRELIAEQAQSSLTATAFCAARGINPKYFSLRKNQLATSASSAFVRVQTPPPATHIVEIITGAATMRISLGVPAQWLADIIKAIR
ncbi:MAG: IS66 family insertion sequence element accessory protein TnpB [Marinagarivorans sp.]|nr:IS66 family insertion sequence element accessory protein TnpB [Marinagarivorans sp.]MDZ7924448.1 IS66 family insertion sequence element accessory protein TnpB [Marinagarivorans sp.]